jgi:D-arabinose 1-dehydrogenase-like Zn-dependent alcohol dehydrogenase
VAALRQGSIEMAKMKAVQIPKVRGAFELVERDRPEPESGQVRIKVQACGVCHSDSWAKEGSFPVVHYPVIPGHEIAGIIDAVGPGVSTWKTGQRSESGGMAGIAVNVNPAGAGTS